MKLRSLGNADLSISRFAFGAGPVSALMTTPEREEQQIRLVARATAAGINWFDTAATYGNGESERALGRALASAKATDNVHVATKVRLFADDLADVPAAVHRSLTGSLQRLGLQRLTMLQLHNSITAERDSQPTSITPRDVLGPRGVLSAFESLRSAGLVSHFGLTGLGEAASLREVICSGAFQSAQVCYHLLNASAGRAVSGSFEEENYSQLIQTCHDHEVRVLAIRVMAGGALAGRAPSAHTKITKFFPLPLYERDLERARELAGRLPPGMTLAEAALRFVWSDERVTSAIVGIGDESELDAALNALAAGPLPADLIDKLTKER